ncbi:hypothetical protein QAD02_023829 [Eretmocerus hayati]|uniref:Uncharacterized protein n=1 Tax=Eretmocerus hayati TaxID=131215 RepID=A0ACC2PXN2_9HYME|nr:hypothetical protein QAD02_023829 [Eretmocerus hayati]
MNLAQYFMSFFATLVYPGGSTSVPDVPTKNQTQPNIIVIVTDDMGWDDVGYHGSNEIPTPNLDALAYSGVILDRHYTLPTCTPSRAAFLTGRHPIRMGLQGLPMNVGEPRAMPLREKILPEYLQKLGYSTKLVGKWHLGYYTPEHTPTKRGFDSFVGYYGGVVTYFNHNVTKDKHCGIDFHLDTPDGIKPYKHDEYLTDFIGTESEKIIRNHNKEKPLYLHIAHLAGHSSEGFETLETRNMSEVNNTLGYIPKLNRRKYAGIITAMDESIGKIMKALSDENMLKNSIIVFMSDNGAPSDISPDPTIPYTNYGSNYPLRGIKSGLHEGGVRVPTVIFSPLIERSSRISNDLFHVTDWFPTLYKLAGGDLDNIKDIDGIDQWPTISQGRKSDRNSVFLNIDEVLRNEGAIKGEFKYMKLGHSSFGKHYGKRGQEYSPSYNVTSVLESQTAKAIDSLKQHLLPGDDAITRLRKETEIKCEEKLEHPDCPDGCLFNIFEDPCETTNIKDKHPEVVDSLKKYISGHKSILMNQTNTYIDPNGYPDNFKGFWMPWLDHEYTPPVNRNLSVIWSVQVFCEGWPADDPRSCL